MAKWQKCTHLNSTLSQWCAIDVTSRVKLACILSLIYILMALKIKSKMRKKKKNTDDEDAWTMFWKGDAHWMRCTEWKRRNFLNKDQKPAVKGNNEHNSPLIIILFKWILMRADAHQHFQRQTTTIEWSNRMSGNLCLVFFFLSGCRPETFWILKTGVPNAGTIESTVHSFRCWPKLWG